MLIATPRSCSPLPPSPLPPGGRSTVHARRRRLQAAGRRSLAERRGRCLQAARPAPARGGVAAALPWPHDVGGDVARSPNTHQRRRVLVARPTASHGSCRPSTRAGGMPTSRSPVPPLFLFGRVKPRHSSCAPLSICSLCCVDLC